MAAVDSTAPPVAPSNSGGGNVRGGTRAALTADIAAASRSLEPPAAGLRRGGRSSGYGGASSSTVDVFGVKGSGTRFVYLFDRSTSMEGAPLAAAKQQLLKSLSALKSVNQFQIIFFNWQPYPIDITGQGRMAFADDRNKRMAASLIGNVTAEEGTDRYTALKRAIDFQPDVIFFLTDADDAMPPSEVAEIARANEGTQAAICVIEFGRDPSPPRDNFLRQLARKRRPIRVCQYVVARPLNRTTTARGRNTRQIASCRWATSASAANRRRKRRDPDSFAAPDDRDETAASCSRPSPSSSACWPLVGRPAPPAGHTPGLRSARSSCSTARYTGNM